MCIINVCTRVSFAASNHEPISGHGFRMCGWQRFATWSVHTTNAIWCASDGDDEAVCISIYPGLNVHRTEEKGVLISLVWFDVCGELNCGLSEQHTQTNEHIETRIPAMIVHGTRCVSTSWRSGGGWVVFLMGQRVFADVALAMWCVEVDVREVVAWGAFVWRAVCGWRCSMVRLQLQSGRWQFNWYFIGRIYRIVLCG